MDAGRTDPPGEGLLEIGRVAKSHGLDGDVILEVGSNRAERTEVGSRFMTVEGQLVVTEVRPHQGRWLVHLEGCDSREQADALRGLRLWAEPIEDEDTLWVHELIGCRVTDQHGTDRGVVTSVLDNPAADLLELDGETLVPVNFVVSGPENGLVTVDVPEGLFEI